MSKIKFFNKIIFFLFIFQIIFFVAGIKNQAYAATYYGNCNNGPKNTDSGGCGTACQAGKAWSKYDKYTSCFKGYEPSGYSWYSGDICLKYLAYNCSTADKCVNTSDNGLKWGNCDCSVGSLYKVCCKDDGSRAPCKQLDQDGIDPKEGVCSSGSTTVKGTSCPQTATPTPTPTPQPGATPTPTPKPGEPTPTPKPGAPTPTPAPGGDIIMCQLIKSFHLISSISSYLVHINPLKSEVFAGWKIK